jgi:tRNA-dihydrouridine synthase B
VCRTAFAECFGGFDSAVAPFIRLRQGHALRPVEIAEVSEMRNRLLPVVPQVHTNHGGRLAEALREFSELGHTEVNLNLGCPSPMVVSRKRGAGLLPYPDRIDVMLSEALADAPLRLSVKLRLGLTDPDDFIPVLDVLNGYPLSRIILHPRTASSMYTGDVDLTRAAQALERSQHPFVYNGSITSPTIFQKLKSRLPGTSGWMIGQGALSNPFLVKQIRGDSCPESNERREVMLAYHDKISSAYMGALNTRNFLLKMRQHWTYLSAVFTVSPKILKKIGHARDIDGYRRAAEWVFQQPLVELEN